MTVIDVSEDDFQAEVLDRSVSTPVVVDFWAEWCGPCRALGPVLEAAAAARAGQVVLAKIDADANPNVTAYFRVNGIPAVKAFRNREVIAQFTGARPPERVAQFFDDLAPSEVDELLAAGGEAELRRARDLAPLRADATVALARLLHERGDDAEALLLLKDFSGSGFRADALAARIRLLAAGAPGLTQAFAALDAGDGEQALELLLEALPAAGEHRGDVRLVLNEPLSERMFAPAAADWRRRLTAALS